MGNTRQQMMNHEQREEALARMQQLSNAFYHVATSIGVHPFIEFAGLMNEYLKCAREAHEAGIDFSACNTHCSQDLPMHPHSITYINEKLECIFTGRSVMQGEKQKESP